ncbi:MAG: hypothetical protein AAGF84_07035 [Planctomycetota bacterium]
MAEPPFDLKKGHRWFAVELNNLGWAYVEADSVTDEQAERMVHAAHGACFHWLEAGDLLNHLRAQCLLASAYTAAGLPDSAVRHADKCLALSVEAGDTQTDFDRACVHGCAALAFSQAGEPDKAKPHGDALEKAFARLKANDQEVIERLYRGPLSTGCR